MLLSFVTTTAREEPVVGTGFKIEFMDPYNVFIFLIPVFMVRGEGGVTSHGEGNLVAEQNF